MAVPEVGKFVVCIVMSGRKIIETWQQNNDIESKDSRRLTIRLNQIVL